MIINSSIADRLLNAFPSAVYGLPALMQLSEIVESTTVPSAAVECTGRPRLFINPEFVEKHAETPEKLVMLVMHELHHVILGHTRLYPRLTPLDNLVFDAVINSMLCWLMKERAMRALFVDFYDHAKFPECFLRPPPGWHHEDAGTTPAALAGPKFRHLADLHRRLYEAEGVTCDELREALSQEAIGNNDGVTLLGDHRPLGSGSSSDGDLENRAPEFLEHTRRIVERWPQPPVPIAGRATSQFLNVARVCVGPPDPRNQLVGLLRRVAGPRGTASHCRLIKRRMQVESPLPCFDRRTAVLRGLGHRPALYHHEIQCPQRGHGGERVHVYLDVSGSMETVVGALYRAVLDCAQCVHPVVHLFSTQVADVPFTALRRGVCPTTGGTSIECVADHIAEHKVQRAVLVTDGFVGRPGVGAHRTLRNCRLGVALTGPSTQRSDLGDLVEHWLILKGANS